jgi:predicted transcriptional regulator
MWKELRKLIKKLLEQLNIFWNASDDPRYKGEHPKCSKIVDEIESEFKEMSDDEIKEILDDLSPEQLEQILMAMEDLVDSREIFEPYIEIINSL